MTRRNRAVVTLSLFFGLLAVPVVLAYRQVRQARLDHALNAAVDRNDVVQVRSLLRQGADANALAEPSDLRPTWRQLWDMVIHRTTDPVGEFSPLWKAAGWTPPQRAAIGPDGYPTVIVDNVDTVEALIDAGADLDFRGGYSRSTPLIAATWFGKVATVKALVEHHADVNATDRAGDLALVSFARGARASMVEFLLQHGAHVDEVDREGRSALRAALESRNHPRILPVRETVACLIRHGASVKVAERDGASVMVLARRFKDPDLLEMLRRAGGSQ